MSSEDIKSFLPEYLVKYFDIYFKKLGFIDDNIKEKYLSQLYNKYEKKFRYKTKYVYNGRGYSSKVDYTKFDFAQSTFTDLSAELIFKTPRTMRTNRGQNLKHIEDYLINDYELTYVSASNIASYTYCPISYCIQKSFNEEPTEEGEIGVKLHADSRLVRYTNREENKYEINKNVTSNTFHNDYNSEFFTDIKQSNVYYIGHSKMNKQYFKSSKGKFVGQLDYIFINKNNDKFIVEEKFINIRKESLYFKDSHKVQTTSYIEGLDSIQATYGYLVYWYYTYIDNEITIEKCNVLKINKTKYNTTNLREVYKNILKINEGNIIEFDVNRLDASKCANCVVKKFCGHKSGRFKSFSIPYDQKYCKLINS